ncbi:MAG: hypothetical protein IJ133_00780 [Clostridia bacterium]|nr:hypothetical protein [Clostridia bacterium]
MAILCDECVHFYFDEEEMADLCDVDMDEDEFRRVSQSSFQQCPFYRPGDEYTLVRKQN